MAALLYFIPRGWQMPAEELAKTGFAFADLAGLPGGQCANGPDGGPGVVVALEAGALNDAPIAAYRPDKQTWVGVNAETPKRQNAEMEKPKPGPPRYWIGWETARPPTPADLQHRALRDGHDVRLADGHLWRVPVVRQPLAHFGDAAPGWPARLSLNGDDRRLARRVDPAYLDAWAMTQRLWNVYIGAATDAEVCDEVTLFRVAAAALGLNYRVSADEVDALGLFTNENLAEVVHAMLDVPRLLRIQAELAAAAAVEKKT